MKYLNQSMLKLSSVHENSSMKNIKLTLKNQSSFDKTVGFLVESLRLKENGASNLYRGLVEAGSIEAEDLAFKRKLDTTIRIVESTINNISSITDKTVSRLETLYNVPVITESVEEIEERINENSITIRDYTRFNIRNNYPANNILESFNDMNLYLPTNKTLGDTAIALKEYYDDCLKDTNERMESFLEKTLGFTCSQNELGSCLYEAFRKEVGTATIISEDVKDTLDRYNSKNNIDMIREESKSLIKSLTRVKRILEEARNDNYENIVGHGIPEEYKIHHESYEYGAHYEQMSPIKLEQNICNDEKTSAYDESTIRDLNGTLKSFVENKTDFLFQESKIACLAFASKLDAVVEQAKQDTKILKTVVNKMNYKDSSVLETL